MQQVMEQGASIYRTGKALEEAVDKLKALQARVPNLALDDRSHTFNTELTGALELAYMLDVAQTIVQSALQRLESRGSHQSEMVSTGLSKGPGIGERPTLT